MKIEIGKRYVTRDGRVTSELQDNTDAGWARYPYFFTLKKNGSVTTFTCDEKGFYSACGKESNIDLVKEYRPSFWNSNRIWTILFITLCMMIGGAINSLIYEHDRREWRETKKAEWKERMGAVEHTQRQADSVLNEAREVAREIKNK